MVYIIAKLSLSICAFLKASIERIVFETLSIGIFSVKMFQVEGLFSSLKSTATENHSRSFGSKTAPGANLSSQGLLPLNPASGIHRLDWSLHITISVHRIEVYLAWMRGRGCRNT